MSDLMRVMTVTLNPALDLTVPLEGLRLGAVNKAGGVELRPAGKGVNVAAMLRLHGVPVSAGGLLPAHDAPVFGAFLDELGIGNAFETIPGRTRINVKLVETEISRVTDVNTQGATVPEGTMDRVWARIAKEAPGILVLSGSLPPGLPPETWAGLVAKGKAAGHIVALDTSGAALAPALAAKPDLIKPNREELAAYLGRDLEGREGLIEAARALRAQGIARVVISDGSAGALFALPQGMVWAKPPKVTLTTTVGAGDSMVAGLCAAIARGLGPEETARLATATAAAAVSRPPGGLPDSDTIARLAQAVTVESLGALLPEGKY
ncbi:1-phosphofructokinase [Acetobacteraceae bacterium H6797]|nr:1-phosphofructokinase [Acetobacteraceae bacterium H6797]